MQAVSVLSDICPRIPQMGKQAQLGLSDGGTQGWQMLVDA